MMNTTVLVKVGVIPGAISEYVLEVGSTVAQALELANLSAEGYDVRLDGNATSLDAVLTADSKLIVLCKMIKGNSDTVVVKVGTIPGAIQEYAVEEGTSVKEVLTLANLNSTGFEIRMDGEKVQLDDVVETDTRIILLVKEIKGNAPVVKIGQIPGAINEFALESGTTVTQALTLAGLTSEGYDVRLDGTQVSLDTVIPENAKLLILAKLIKGNR